MKLRTIITCFFILLMMASYGQAKNIDIMLSHDLGKNFYSKGDYLSAYKYFLIYKYCNLDSLTNLKDKTRLQNIEEVIKYCEAHLKTGLSEYFAMKAKGFSAPVNVDSLKKLIIARAPKLLDK